MFASTFRPELPKTNMRRVLSVSTIDLNDTGSVADDVDAEGTIVGIEILEIQLPGQIETARTFAETHGLAFPRDLAGNLAAP